MRRLPIVLILLLVLALLAASPVSAAPGDRAASASPMFATGDIGCDGAEDTTNKVGMAMLRPVDDGIAYKIVLNGIEPNWPYYIELQIETNDCQDVAHFVDGFTSDKNGHLHITGVFEMGPGTYRANIDVVSPIGPPDADPRNREIGGYGFIEVTGP